MPLIPLELPRESAPGRYGHDAPGRLVNCHAEFAGEGGKVPYPLHAHHGLTLKLTTSGGGACRGMIVVGPYLLAVFGTRLYKIDQSFNEIDSWGLAGTGMVSMAKNRANPVEVAIAAEGRRFIWSNDVLTEISDTNLPAAVAVAFINGYFVWAAASSSVGRYHWSGIDDGFTYGANDFLSAESKPDGLRTLITRKTELWLMGESSIEIHYNPSSGTRTFARLQGAVVEQTCKNGATVALLEETVIWVASDNTVRAAEGGYRGAIISSHAVSRSIRDTSDPDALQAFAYQDGGHSWYVLIGADFTWQYNFTTRRWTERDSRDSGADLGRWRVQCYALFAGFHLVGDFRDGKLWAIDAASRTEGDEPLIMSFRLHIHAWPVRVRVNKLHIDAVTGVGLNTAVANNEDPQLILKRSSDNGKTFTYQKWRSLGEVGEYKVRCKFSALGSSPSEDGFVFEIRIAADVVKSVTGAAVDAAGLNN